MPRKLQITKDCEVIEKALKKLIQPIAVDANFALLMGLEHATPTLLRRHNEYTQIADALATVEKIRHHAGPIQKILDGQSMMDLNNCDDSTDHLIKTLQNIK